MTVYNGEKYLRAAIDSILKQTFSDFEFIIVDDASSDGSADIIRSYHDPRIRLISNRSNLKVPLSANKGLDLARGEYLARMDADDISLPGRLARQVAFMDAHPEVGVCGSWAKDIDSAGNIIGERITPVGRELECYYWRPSPITNSTAMIRVKHLGELRYDPEMPPSEDYDLWLRMKHRCRFSNLPEFLVLYRVHDESLSATQGARQFHLTYEAFCRHIGSSRISYDAFLSLCYLWHRVNPLSRLLAMRRLAAAIRTPYFVFLKDDVRYTKQWLYEWLHKLLSRTRTIGTARSLRRWMKLQG
jgi:glycosyltransferase involved in cell wall biosynthesis